MKRVMQIKKQRELQKRNWQKKKKARNKSRNPGDTTRIKRRTGGNRGKHTGTNKLKR